MKREPKKATERGRVASRSWWDLIFAALLIIVTFLVYQPAWRGKPILDDTMHVTNTIELRSINGLVHLWIDPPTNRQYHPLLDTVYWIEDKLWGESLLGYHLVNISLHLVAAFLLLKILRRLEVSGAWIATAIFALHPVQVESVAWMTELKNTLSGVLFFGSLLAYLHFDQTRSARWYATVLFLFSLGLLVKPIVAILPGAILIVLWWKRGKVLWKRDLSPLIPFLIVGIAAGLLAAWMEREFAGAKGHAFDFSLPERAQIAGRAFWFYIGKLFWPTELVLIYPRWDVNRWTWSEFLFPVAAIGLFVLLWVVGRKRRWLLAGPLFFLLGIFPFLGFFNIRYFNLSFVADHFQYLPSIGIIAPVSAGLAVLVGPRRTGQQTIAYAICVALLGTLAVLSWKQSHLYQDPETCYRTVLQKNPNSGESRVEIGRVLFEKGSFDEAEAQFQGALAVRPNDPGCRMRAYHGLGNILLKKGRIDDAINDLQKALEADPNYSLAHTSLGSAYYLKGLFAESIAHYEKSLQLHPRGASTQSNLAWILATCPDSAFRNGPRAVTLAERAVQLSNGTNPAFLRTLAAAYAESGRFSKAAEAAYRALEFSRKTPRYDVTRAIQNELNLYRAALPYRERR